jgi:hypothetical protein
MARFYFHLSAPGEYFADNVGYDVSDPGAAHYIAVRLAGRVMKFVPFFQNRALDFRHWTALQYGTRSSCKTSRRANELRSPLTLATYWTRIIHSPVAFGWGTSRS